MPMSTNGEGYIFTIWKNGDYNMTQPSQELT